MDKTQLPSREELFAEKGWDRAPSYRRSALGLDLVACRYNEHKPNDWYEIIGTDRIGYVKGVTAPEAFREHLFSRLAACAGLVSAPVDTAPFRPEAAHQSHHDCDDNSTHVCFSPLLGMHPRTLGRFLDEATYSWPKLTPDLAEQINEDVSSLIPFWIWEANMDTHPRNIVIASPDKDRKSAFIYGIDHACAHFQPHFLANGEAIIGESIRDLFERGKPFHIDLAAMAKTAEAIISIPQNKIREQIEQSFDQCRISLSGIASPQWTKHLPSAPEIENILHGRSQRLETDIRTPSYMAKAFGLLLCDYEELNVWNAPIKPRVARTVKVAAYAR